MGHHITVEAEQYTFKPETKRTLLILIGVGLLVFALGVVLAMNNGHGEHEAAGHASAEISQKLVASAESISSTEPVAEAHGEHHESPTWLKRIYTSLWMNNIYFVGLGLVGLFFVCIQYAAQAGWSSGLQRVPFAMGRWIPIAGVLTIALWVFTGQELFHWTHDALYDKSSADYDSILDNKSAYFFWPLTGESFPVFYMVRMVLFFIMWYMFYLAIKKRMVAEDLDGDTIHWFKSSSISAWFIVFFAVSSSVAAWDWVMSIDAHWFSTMFGWYVFASWWVTGLAFTTFIVASLKKAGYLKIVRADHLHDLGKFCFAFSIFWTYIWFSQFMLIYYANIPEETVYFIERMRTNPYSWIFYTNLIMNFVLPFLLFMTRDAKRQVSMLLVVCPIIMMGHWFDFFNMITPGVMKYQGGVGFLELGLFMVFLGTFLFVVLNGLTKLPLIGRNHPMLQESLHHHI